MNRGTVDIRRVIEKLDEYLNRRDYDAGERHLEYWLAEAEQSGDMRGALSLLNELIGLYRKTAKRQECLDTIKKALGTAESMGLEGSVTLGTHT